jgi:hypothetical protein
MIMLSGVVISRLLPLIRVELGGCWARMIVPPPPPTMWYSAV